MTTAATRSQTDPQKRVTGPRTAGTSTQDRRRRPAKKTAPAATVEQQPTQAEKLLPASKAERPKAKSELVTWQDVPMPHVKVPVVHGGPAARSVVSNVRWTAHTLASAVPPPERLLYYGGVGALAALGVVEWPIAVAAAAGVWVATHSRRSAESPRPTEAPEAPHGKTRATSGPVAAAAR
ncbi:hypothetical protein [Dactylosporangium sp. NPDC050588]|uniref:hypothetical protein n=1 Tax=Dactylosporangium sp. NPDC050588 TaxID=3157211 RepID=UPI0033EEA431